MSSEDRSNFRPKVGETYQLRGGGTGEVLRDDLAGTDTSLAVLVRQYGEVGIRVLPTNGKHPYLDKCIFDLMPPQPEKKYRPWTREELKEFAKRDGWVQSKTDKGCFFRVNGFDFEDDAIVGTEYIPLDILLRDYTQDDEAKTPCGVEVAE